MDNNIISAGNMFVGKVKPDQGGKVGKKQQESFVIDSQMPSDKSDVKVQLENNEPAGKKEVTHKKPGLTHEKIHVSNGRTGDIVIHEGSIPSTLFIDDIEMPLNFPSAVGDDLKIPQELPGPEPLLGIKSIPVAGPDTIFYSQGLNSIVSIARDWRIFNVEGEEVFFGGTGFASPSIAGEAALLLQQNPDLTVGEIRQ